MFNAAITMVYKLNDATFRPFFVRLVEWAERELPKSDVRGRADRARTLFSFLEVLFDKLKGIVISYSSYILDLSSAHLTKSDLTDETSAALTEVILGALRKSFEHDQDEFWQSPAHFSAIADPILDQLPASTSPSSHLSVTETVIPTLSALALAAQSPDHHTHINTTLLKLFRSDNAHVRLAAVKAQRSLTEKMGEEWLEMISQMLPAISEAFEDDDEAVEREARAWVEEIEEVLGEGVEGMLA